MKHLYGLRLVELHLAGHRVESPNHHVTDEDIIYMLKNTKSIKVLDIAYATSKLLNFLKNNSE